jgi:hypothetical protein
LAGRWISWSTPWRISEILGLICEIFLTTASVAVLIALVYSAVSGQCGPKGIAALVVGGLYFAAHPMAPLSLTWWSNNSFALIGQTLLGLNLLRVARADGPPRRRAIVELARDESRRSGEPGPSVVCTARFCVGWSRVSAQSELPKQAALVLYGPALLVQTLALLFVIEKHPGVVYLLSVAAMMPLLAATWFESEALVSNQSRRILFGGSALVGVALVANFVVSTVSSENAYTTNRASNAAVERALEQFAAQRGVPSSSLTVVWGYGTANRCYALWFGVPDVGALSSNVEQECEADVLINVCTGEAHPLPWDIAVVPGDMHELNPSLTRLGARSWA